MTSLTQRQVGELQQSSKRTRQEAKAAARGKGTQRKEDAQGNGLSEGQPTLWKVRLSMAHSSMAVEATMEADLGDWNSRAVSPNTQPDFMWILILPPSTCRSRPPSWLVRMSS